MRYIRFIFLFFCFGLGTALAQGPTYNFGTPLTESEIKAADTLVDQEGKLLPEGEGTVAQGTALYAQRCAMCHGPNGEGTSTPAGVGPMLIAPNQEGTRGIRHLHFATTLFSYIYRAMPMHQERTLSVDDAYSLTAFLLYRNGIIGEKDIINDNTLPDVAMPNRDEWSSPPESSG